MRKWLRWNFRAPSRYIEEKLKRRNQSQNICHMQKRKRKKEEQIKYCNICLMLCWEDENVITCDLLDKIDSCSSARRAIPWPRCASYHHFSVREHSSPSRTWIRSISAAVGRFCIRIRVRLQIKKRCEALPTDRNFFEKIHGFLDILTAYFKSCFRSIHRYMEMNHCAHGHKA